MRGCVLQANRIDPSFKTISPCRMKRNVAQFHPIQLTKLIGRTKSVSLYTVAINPTHTHTHPHKLTIHFPALRLPIDCKTPETTQLEIPSGSKRHLQTDGARFARGHRGGGESVDDTNRDAGGGVPAMETVPPQRTHLTRAN